jgi:hypothetical protein
MNLHYNVKYMNRNFNVRLSEEEWEKLEKYCSDTGRSKTALLKGLITRLGDPNLEKILGKSRYSDNN